MREEIADVVYPVFTLGIRLKDRLATGEEPDFANSQKELKGLLQATGRAQNLADYGGDKPSSDSLRGSTSGMRGAGDHFLGIRYALVCWLDEIFIIDSPWNDQWSERSLEWEHFGQKDRAWKFWEQAERAGSRPTTDALEVYYLCVMLGFRGEMAEKPEELKKWCERAKTQIDQGQAADFNLPVDGQPPTNVPLLTGAGQLQKMQMITVPILLLLILPLTVWLVLLLKKFLS